MRVELVSVISSEPDDAPDGDDGRTSADVQDATLGAADASIDLRAERAGRSPGRNCTLTYRAIDLAGHATEAFAIVTVPHDRRTASAPRPRMPDACTGGCPGAYGIATAPAGGATDPTGAKKR